MRGTGKKGSSFEVVGRVPLPVNIITWPSCRTPVKFDASSPRASTSSRDLTEDGGLRAFSFSRGIGELESTRFERSGSFAGRFRDEKIPSEKEFLTQFSLFCRSFFSILLEN